MNAQTLRAVALSMLSQFAAVSQMAKAQPFVFLLGLPGLPCIVLPFESRRALSDFCNRIAELTGYPVEVTLHPGGEVTAEYTLPGHDAPEPADAREEDPPQDFPRLPWNGKRNGSNDERVFIVGGVLS